MNDYNNILFNSIMWLYYNASDARVLFTFPLIILNICLQFYNSLENAEFVRRQ